MKENNLVFRKNKGIKEVNDSLRKAKKNGNYKTEQELEFLIIYLKNDVLKNAPKNSSK
jgi:hypothetical protein